MLSRHRPKITNCDSSSISNSGYTETKRHEEETHASENSEWNLKSWPSYIFSQITERFLSSKNNDNDSENEEDAKKSLLKPQFEESQVDMITISGYRKKSVEKLFMYLKGQKDFLNKCCDISVLLDMLSICHFMSIPGQTNTRNDKP